MNLCISSAPSTRTLTQEHGSNHGVDADEAEHNARELTTAFQDALSHSNTDANEDAMDVDSNMHDSEGEDDKEEEVAAEVEEGAVIDPQVRSAKEWVCTYYFLPMACRRVQCLLKCIGGQLHPQQQMEKW